MLGTHNSLSEDDDDDNLFCFIIIGLLCDLLSCGGWHGWGGGPLPGSDGDEQPKPRPPNPAVRIVRS